ncbi:MAG: Kef family K(+) transporter [Bauldia sp.]|nr:Kef family K(+) transporter [Bauldia sp.]
MAHDIPLITIIVAGLGVAFILGAIAHRLKISPLVGYLLAGVLIGPATPGFVADVHLASELAELGVILLMFGVGLHFSLGDLLSVRSIAIPGAIGQISIATLMGVGLAFWLGWPLGSGLVFGLALSVASTVVLLRALQERRMVDTEKGRIAVGWLIVEDLAMVLALVVIPALSGVLGGEENGEASGSGGLFGAIALTLGKVAAFVVLMLVVGRQVIPWILHRVVYTGSRELFRLAVLAIALGVAFGAASLFEVSFALGAFFAGMVMNESPLSQRAAQEILPLRDAFAVLFFVSVGMLFDPAIVLTMPVAVFLTVAIILVGKSAAAYAIVRAFGHSHETALTISASLAQIGEFSFILAALGVGLGLLPEDGQDLILAGAMISILLNPLFFAFADRLQAKAQAEELAHPPAQPSAAEAHPVFPPPAADHAVVVGHGRVGSHIAEELRQLGVPLVVTEENSEHLAALKDTEVPVIVGNAVRPEVLAAANVSTAKYLFIAIPEAFEAGQIAEQSRAANPRLTIVARVHSDPEVDHMLRLGATSVVMGEREIARGMLEFAFGEPRGWSGGPGQAVADGGG